MNTQLVKPPPHGCNIQTEVQLQADGSSGNKNLVIGELYLWSVTISLFSKSLR